MRLSRVLAEAMRRSPNREETRFLLSADGGEMGPSFYLDLFSAAYEVRRLTKGSEFVLDGFLGTVARCTVEPPCWYCSRSRGADLPPPLDLDEVAEGARYIARTGTRRIEVGAGTNPEEADRIVRAARLAAEASGLRVWVNAGPSFRRRHLEQLKEAGIEAVGSSLETINPGLFARVKPGDSLEARVELARQIKAVGLGLVSVMMVGLGSATEDYVEHLFWLKDLGADHVPITGLNPIPGTPLAKARPATPLEVCRVVAVARLVLRTPDISTGGMMNDPRLLPMQIMAGANRAIHLGAHVHRRPGGGFRMWPAIREAEEQDGLIFSNLRPLSERIIAEMGLVAA